MSVPDTALAEFCAELSRRAGGELCTDHLTRTLYSTDASLYQVMPLAVFIPRDADDVQAAVSLAAQYRIPVLPRTSGTSLAGQAVNEAVVIDFTRHLDAITELIPEEKKVRVQPGIVLDELNLRLQPHGLKFGPDPASSNRAALGGIVSNNSTGSHSILYGMTADHVLAAQVILSDGSRASFHAQEDDALQAMAGNSDFASRLHGHIHALAADNAGIIRAGTPRHWRRCGGYNLDRFVPGTSSRLPRDPRFNLAKLVCGAEGTLGVLTEITLNLVELPRRTALALVHFDSLQEALEAVPVMLETGPAAVELLDHFGLTLCRDVPAYARLLRTFLHGDPNCLLITEFYGDSEKELAARIDSLQQHLRRHGHRGHITPALSPGMQQDVWTVRKVGLGLMMSMKGDFKPIPFIEDAAVPVEHLAEYISRIEAFCHELGTDVAYYAHASAGCLHVRPLMNMKDPSEVDKLQRIAAHSAELVAGYGGAISSEHADGRCRSWLNQRIYGPELYQLFVQVKKLFDPQNIFNPGIIVGGQDIRDNLRYGSSYRAHVPETFYDFSDEQGFDRAVEMCNGAGICRKRIDGTMCPSFMVTREEKHSTRGRANALRAAISGRLDAEGLTSRQLFDVLDLCVECKACRAECPSSVDMARLKFEFLAQYHARHGLPLRDRIFAAQPALARWMTRLHLQPVFNAVQRSHWLRKGLETALGISASRQLPELSSHGFMRWFAKRRPQQGQQKVMLFHDCFTTHFEPEIPRAAVELFERAGFEVILSPHLCCGRPFISKGMHAAAQKAARRTVAALSRAAEEDIAIVGLEPGCLLTLRDEYRYLLPGDARVARVADRTFLFDEFIGTEAAAQFAKLNFKKEAIGVFVHGHCHQKALVGTGPLQQMLALPPGWQVEEAKAGCCGMAGAFGYEAEHYDISLQMGAHRLFPRVRENAEKRRIAASGFSCRQQIRHGTGVSAQHPVVLLREALQE